MTTTKDVTVGKYIVRIQILKQKLAKGTRLKAYATIIGVTKLKREKNDHI